MHQVTPRATQLVECSRALQLFPLVQFIFCDSHRLVLCTRILPYATLHPSLPSHNHGCARPSQPHNPPTHCQAYQQIHNLARPADSLVIFLEKRYLGAALPEVQHIGPYEKTHTGVGESHG